MMQHLLAYTAKGSEFAVEAALNDMGAFACVPRKAELVRLPKQRRPAIVESPKWDNYVLAGLTPDQWQETRAGIRVLVPDGKWTTVRFTTVMWISEREWTRYVMTAVDLIEKEYQSRMEQFEAGERLSEYEPGDILQLLGEPLGAKFATFRRLIEGKVPMLEAEVIGMTLMGQPVRLKVDPVNARRAADSI